MKEEKLIQQVKEANGNSTYSNKELLFYIVGRVDKLDDKLDETIKNFNTRLDKKLDKKSFATIALVGVSALTALLGGMFKFLYSLIK